MQSKIISNANRRLTTPKAERDLCKTPPFAQIALKLHFVPASDLNFKPQNTQCIPAFKIFAFLELEQN
jgi:hypothetical protein